MAVFDTFRPAGTARAGFIARIWAETFGALAAWNDARLTRNALSKLSAHELNDIGLCEADIDMVTRR